MNKTEFFKKYDLEKLINEGERVSERIKSKYSNDKGKYLAIEPESGDVYLGKSLFESLRLARKDHPYALLYIVKIGSNKVIIDLFTYIEPEK
jgi:hypothetical protein